MLIYVTVLIWTTCHHEKIGLQVYWATGLLGLKNDDDDDDE